MIAPTQNTIAQNDTAANAPATQSNAPKNAPDHTDIQGRFSQYQSGFWALTLPALSARYVLRYFDAMGLFGKSDPTKPSRKYAALAGSWMLLNTGIYTERTYSDMKRLLAETVSYETGKDPNSIGMRDFMKSDNVIVQSAMHNFFKRTLLRAGVTLTFFASFLLPKRFREGNKADAVDLGVGATGAYLYTDGYIRKTTFFESLQSLIDRKINHSDAVGEVITDNDLMNLYATHMRDGAVAKHAQDSVLTQRMDTLAWKQDQAIFGRMAELMNETYSNEPNREGANFTVPKLLYLLGHDMIQRDHIKQSLAYIEIANKYGIPSVKQVKAAVDQGHAFSEVAKQFPVSESSLQPSAGFTQERTGNYVERLAQQEQIATAERTIV